MDTNDQPGSVHRPHRRAARIVSRALLVALPFLAHIALAAIPDGFGATRHRAPLDAAMLDAIAALGFLAWSIVAGLGLAAVALGASMRPRTLPRDRTAAADPPTQPAGLLLAAAATVQPLLPRRETAEDSIEVVHLHNATDEARVYLALHHVDLAIGVLRSHVDDEPDAKPVAWLMLLDLYRTHQRVDAFRELAQRFHDRFNAQTPQWDCFPPKASEPGLEAFPRLIKEIALCWGTHECRRLLDRLLYDNRQGRRMGFTLNAYKDLLLLRRLSDGLLSTIEADFAEEAKVRSVFSAASALAFVETNVASTSAAEQRADAACAGSGARSTNASAREASAHVVHAGGERIGTDGQAHALAQELCAQLDEDLRAGGEARSALEIEHPALCGMLVREWANAPLAARLCELFAAGGDGAHPLSPEAASDVEMLKRVAAQRSRAEGIEPQFDLLDGWGEPGR